MHKGILHNEKTVTQCRIGICLLDRRPHVPMMLTARILMAFPHGQGVRISTLHLL